MGGGIFDSAIKFTIEEYNKLDELIKENFIENVDYLTPLRLDNKNSYGDYDLIVNDTEKFINFFSSINFIKEIEVISLFEKKYDLYSKHILNINNNQIDLLKSWNEESMEISRIFYSYCYANIYLRRFLTQVDSNLKLTFLGIMCSSNKYVIPEDVKNIKIDNNMKLIIDCKYLFDLIDLDYDRFIKGFKDEYELLDYFKESKYYNNIKFKNNSKFKHDYKRLEPFRNIVDKGLVVFEN